MNYWVAVYRVARLLAVILAVVVAFFVFLPKYNRLRQLQQQKLQLREENRRVQTRTLDLRQRQERFRGEPAFVERTAREMGMVKPGETVFKTTTPAMETSNKQIE